MEASAVHAPAALGRLSLGGPLLRLRSDDQLVNLFRAGSDDAFAVIHDRYRQRLFAYVRQMLPSASRQDAEDVLQDVFLRAYSALRADGRQLHLRAWLYRVAHNRCIDQVRRPVPPAADIFEMSRTPLVDPLETAQRRDDLRRLVTDVGRLPDQQRSALLMREIDGVSYAHIAEALGVTVPAVKSLLVRARVGLAEAAEARETDCELIRHDLAGSYERGVKASARARRHMRECGGCREFRTSLRSVRRQFAALSPLTAAGPLAFAVKALGVGGAGSGAAAGAGGGAAVVGTATACKVAAVVCTAAIATGGAVEVKQRVVERAKAPAAAGAAAGAAQAAAAAPSTSDSLRLPVEPSVIRHRTEPARRIAAPASPDRARRRVRRATGGPAPAARPAEPADDAVGATGGAEAPVETTLATPVIEQVQESPAVASPGEEDGATGTDAAQGRSQDPEPDDTSASGGASPAAP